MVIVFVRYKFIKVWCFGVVKCGCFCVFQFINGGNSFYCVCIRVQVQGFKDIFVYCENFFYSVFMIKGDKIEVWIIGQCG